MSKGNEKAELPSEDEVSEAQNFIRSEKASTSAPETRRNLGSSRDKAEYVELDEEKDVEKTSLHRSWLLILTLTNDSETACEKFINNDGLLHFMVCYDENPSDEQLLTLMMATISNLSEHPPLRPTIMEHELLSTFFLLLDAEFSISEGAASVLCNLAVDGPKLWADRNPSRESVLAKIEAVIVTWNPDVQLQFHYTSLKPLLNLLQIRDTWAPLKYALWILRNLLSDGRRGEEYREMLKEEREKSVLEKLVGNPVSPQYIKLRAEDLLREII